MQEANTNGPSERSSHVFPLGTPWNRPPQFQTQLPARGESVGAWLSEAAQMKAQNVHCFRQLVQELAVLDAPRRLTQGARAALRDEMRHARLMSSLAEQFSSPVPQVKLKAVSVRGLLPLALENARDVCGTRTFTALVRVLQAGRAADPRVARAMRRIGHDEVRHAQFAWDLHDWCVCELADAEALRVEQALADSLRDRLSLCSPSAMSTEQRRVLGVPDAAELDDLARRMVRSIEKLRSS